MSCIFVSHEGKDAGVSLWYSYSIPQLVLAMEVITAFVMKVRSTIRINWAVFAKLPLVGKRGLAPTDAYSQ